MNPKIQTYFDNLLRLMALEAEAEKEQALLDRQRRSPQAVEDAGEGLMELVVIEEDAGLGDRLLLTLGKRNQTLSLPWTRLGAGAPVILSLMNPGANETEGWRGVVSRVNRQQITVAFDRWPTFDEDRPILRLDRSTDEVSRRRQEQAIERVRSARSGRLAELRDVLLGHVPAIFEPTQPVTPFDASLNPPQLDAVAHALSAEDVAILHGPPGTGKTTTVVELIRQIRRRGETVLVCAPSNLAVDNVLERLLAPGESALRIGHPARVLPELRDHTLDLMVLNHPDIKLAQKLRKEAASLHNQASRWTRTRPEPGSKQALRREAKAMTADARRLEDQVMERILDDAPILCATLTGLSPSRLGQRHYDWCIIDEAGQSTEPSTWIPLAYADRLVLAGDPWQLPPTVVSLDAAKQGFDVSLLERLTKEQGETLSRRLVVQYRMHRGIMGFSSGEFYEQSLEAHDSVAGHLLTDLPGVAATDLTQTPLTFIDTAGADHDEVSEEEGESRFNPREAEQVVGLVDQLVEAGLPAEAIAVISPYSAQVRLLRGLLEETDCEVDSIDGFQGREKEAVIVSLVRSNRDGEIGFLSDTRRMNVALTRAKRKLIVIGDSATIGSHPFYQRMLDYFDAQQAYRSVWEMDVYL